MKNNTEKSIYESISVSLIQVEANDILTESNRDPVIELPIIPF